MTVERTESKPEAQKPADPSEDLTGRDRMARNVLASWAGHMVFVVAGFIMPRLIDQQIGQTALGVWDFAWSLVSYFGLVQLGIGSSVNRYVAKYRAVADHEGVNRALNSVSCLLIAAGLIVVLLTIGATWLVPTLLSDQLGQYVADARWVVMLLGVSIALRIALIAFDGVITGCHRWDLHNAITSGFYLLTVVGMIIGLLLGGGLRALAVASFLGTLLGEMARVVVAYRVYPNLRLGRKYVQWSQARKMLTFGGKTFFGTMSRLLLYQTNSILIVYYLGPGILALYARPMSLIRHAMTFIGKFSFTLTPTASSMHAADRHEQLRGFLIQTTRYCVYMALPMVLVLLILGRPVLLLWMGERYEQGLILGVLAVGHLMSMAHRPLGNILVGMNSHGWPSLVRFISSVIAVGLGVLVLGPLHWGLIGAALVVTVPQTIIDGVYMPVYTCRRLEIPIIRYFLQVWLRPILCVIPFGIVLLATRLTFADNPLVALASGIGTGGLILTLIYWKYAISPSMRRRIAVSIKSTFGWLAWLRGTSSAAGNIDH